MSVSNKVYDRVNDLVKIGLPALGTLYATLAALWGFPAAEAVVGTLAALAVFGGVVLKIWNKEWAKNAQGSLGIDTSDPEHAQVRLELAESDPLRYKDGDTVMLRVHTDGGK